MPKKNTLVNTAYQGIKNQIISFSLAPNAAISDNQLASELCMSRAPVREAILQLCADGLIEINDAGKPVVAPLGLRDIVEILHVRRALEVEAICSIADNGWLTEKQEKALSEIYQKMIELDNNKLIEHYQYDDIFHSTIITYSGNSRIIKVLDRMTLQMQRARWLNIAAPSRLQQANEEHKEIYQGLMNHELEQATQAMKQHIYNSEMTFKQVFEDPNLKQVMAGIYSFFYN